MPSYTKINLAQIPDVAPEYGLPQTSESRKAAPARAVAGTHLRLVK